MRAPRGVAIQAGAWIACALVAWLMIAPVRADEQVLEHVILPGAADRFARLDLTCWLPDPARKVRAVIVHQHGCGNSSAAANPPVARDFHWQALARKHDCAILVPHYTVTGECAEWNDPDSGSERALFAALQEFARRTGRPELEQVPWLLWGHSGGSSWSVQMILRHPGRVLAASLRGGAHKQFGDPAFRARFVATARDLPLLFVWGEGETKPASRHHVSWEPMQAMYRDLRSAGGRVALAIDPRTEHSCGDSRLLVLPYYDAVLAAHARNAPPPGAWVDVASRDTVTVDRVRATDTAQAWLPSADVARKWREFSATGTVTRSQPPATAPVLWAGLNDAGKTVTLRWRIEPELDGGLRTVRIRRDGSVWREIGGKPGTFLGTGRDSPPYGLHASSLVDEAVQPGAKHQYAISFTDGAGTESPLSAPVVVTVPALTTTDTRSK